MTFTEAAAQVLRLVGKPLHYKEITDVAIEKNLLSHVGKSPEVTMGARLAALVKKGEKENPLIRIKPGVFALREWDQATIDKGLADRTPAIEIARNAQFDIASLPSMTTSEDEEDVASSPDGTNGEDAEPGLPPDAEERARSELAASASELFAAEDDDDVPIFGSAEEESEGGGAAGAAAGEDDGAAGGVDSDGGSRRRRRRRRRGRGGGDELRSSGGGGGGDDLPSYTVMDAPADLELEGERLAQPDAEPTRERAERGDRGDRGDRGGRDRGERTERADRGDRGDRDRGERGSRERDEPLDDVAGKPLADAVAQMLSTFDRGPGPVGIQRIAEHAQRRGRMTGDFQQIQSQLLAAVRADNLRRTGLGQRTRFRVVGNRVALTDWAMDGELGRLEREINALTERFREASRKTLLRRVQDLSPRAMTEIVFLMLERIGMTDVQIVRRPGAPSSELHVSGIARSPAGSVPTAIVVRRDGREIGRERVTELRGALHHYGPASAGWLITTGQVLSGAREEAAAHGAAPITLLDGLGFARLCEEQGVGVMETKLCLPIVDIDLFEALRGG